jgi:hypothetical protein
MFQFFISLQVSEGTVAKPLAETRLELFDTSGNHGWISGGKTDANGKCTFQLPDHVEDWITLSGQTVAVKVYRGGALIHTEAITDIANGLSVDVAIPSSEYDSDIVDETLTTDLTFNYCRIYGIVTTSQEIPLAGVSIQIKEASFRDETILAEVATNSEGRYEIKIALRRIANAEGTAARALLIDAYIAETLIKSSGFVAINGTELEYNISAAPEILPSVSELTAAVSQIGLIAREGETPIPIAELTTAGANNDAAYLARATAIPLNKILAIINAYQYSEDNPTVAPKFFYALMRTTERLDFNSLISQSRSEIIVLITKAVDEVVIDSADTTAIATAADAIIAIKVEKAKEVVVERESLSLDDLLNTTFDNTGLVNDFLTYAAKYDGDDPQQFWSAYPSSTDRTVLRKGLQLLGITGLQPQLANHLMEELGAEGQVHDLATWSQDEWEAVIDDASTTELPAIPKIILDNVDEPDQVSAYATKLKQILQHTFPLTTLKGIFSTTEGEELIPDEDTREEIISFIENNPKFDLRTKSIYDIELDDLSEEATSETLESVQNGLAPYQRLLRVVGGNPELVVSMMTTAENPVTSALDIANLPEEVFSAQYSAALGGSAAAASVHNTAVAVSQLTANWATNVKLNNDPTVLADSPVWPTAAAAPQLAELFGSLEQCACEYCTSVYSPAAYYVDILNFLKTKCITVDSLGVSHYWAFAELIERRADLPFIDLTCKNTNTPVPYVDLVNELLERIIIEQLIPGNSSLATPVLESFQTTGKAAELAARPEHVIRTSTGYENYPHYTEVYDEALSQAVYPYNLPFNLALEQSRIYFKHLGISRYDLMRLYRPWNTTTLIPTTSTEITDYNLKTEYLGLSKESADIVTDTSGSNVWKYYGFFIPSASNPLTYSISILSPTDGSTTLSGTWFNLLLGDVTNGGLDILLHQLKISFKELSQLLRTRFINPKVSGERLFATAAKSGYPDETCILKGLHIQVETGGDVDGFFDKMHRFVRLWRATGKSIYEVDQILYRLGASDIDQTVYTDFIRTLIYATQFNITTEQLSTWWSDIDTEQYPDFDSERQDVVSSQYDRLFKSKSVLNPPDPDFSAVDSSGLPTFSDAYEDHLATISAALGVKDAEVTMLLAALGITASSTITLAGLSRLYGTAKIARGLRLSIDSFIRFAELPELPTVSPVLSAPVSANAQLEVLDRVVAKLDSLSASGFSLDEIMYLLVDEDPNGAFKGRESTVQLFYEALRKELQKILATDNITNKSDAIANAIVQQFAVHFGVSADIARYLLEMLLTADTISGTPVTISVLEAFSKDNFINREYTLSPEVLTVQDPPTGSAPEPLPDWHPRLVLYPTYYLIAKIALLINRLKIRLAELISLQDSNVNLEVLDLTSLPVAGGASLPPELLIRYVQWIVVRDQLRVDARDFAPLTNMTDNPLTKTEWKSLIVSITGWDAVALDELVGPNGDNTDSGLLHADFLALATTPVYEPVNNPEFISQIANIMEASKRLGLKPGELINALYSSIVLEDANRIMNAARAKHSEEQWLKIAKPLQDGLREKQRQALVAYVIANPGMASWKNENEVYAHLMIDVEMKPCMLTSRIKQAISAVQLYVDRVIMNLEYYQADPTKQITIHPDQIQEWKTWRKWYRIWEANRKIFLYPENWIEPELRDDKSVFFKELETRLLQDEVKSDKVEDAYYEYLNKLDEVACMDPVTSFHELNEDNNIDIIHVVARTYSHPQHYYYRRFENNQWSPWERLNLEIKGDHVALVVWNRRLYIYWLTFIEKSYNEDEALRIKQDILFNILSYGWEYWVDQMTTLLTDGGNDRFKYWMVQLNWSELKDGKWLAPMIAKDVMELKPHKIVLSGRESLFFSTVASRKDSRDFYSFLANKTEIKIHEMFRNRLYLLPVVESPSRLVLSVTFGGGLDEYYVSLHSFICDGNQAEPRVLRDDDRHYQFVAPIASITNKMKFRQSPLPTGVLSSRRALLTDGYNMIPGSWTGHYRYAYDNITLASPVQMPEHAWTQKILNNTPFGQFVITARSDTSGMGSYQEWHPLDNNFFYEDIYNHFFVRKVKVWQAYGTIAALTSGDMDLPSIADMYSEFYVKTYDPSVSANASVFDVTTTVTTQFAGYEISKYYFQNFAHPHIHNFFQAFNKDGIDGLLRIEVQNISDTLGFVPFYSPTALVANTYRYPYPVNSVDFHFDGTYSQYNWELFFHIPMLVAQSLTTNQQFEAAQKWYHYVFNPTSNTDDANQISGHKKRFWKFRPFYEEADGSAYTAAFFVSLSKQIQVWHANPFQPHVIARMRILAYMKNVVMKYLDNLIAWGDQLFRRNTIESINEATQLYILAANILGPKPQEISARAVSAIHNFDELVASGLDEFSNAQVKIEAFIDPNVFSKSTGSPGAPATPPTMAYFCLASNDMLLAYWDKVADRLFKIRNCMNIEGVRQQLPLFEPPIDPALLVRAAAAGVDIGSISDFAAQKITGYRFSYVLQKANELVSDVKSLGNSILLALEKRDAEQLALLRSGQEIDLLDKVTFVKESQLSEAKSALEALQKTKENTTQRLQYYSSRPFTNSSEQRHLESIQTGVDLQQTQARLQTAASTLSLIPQFHGQGPAAVGASFGGQQLAAGISATSAALGIEGIINNAKGTMAATLGSYQRRQDDWAFQSETARKELEQLDKQIVGAEIRIDIAQRELNNHLKQLDNSRNVDEYMRQKFTNQELYSWTISQLAAIYFQTYQLAYDLARKAEKCYDYELPQAIDKKPKSGFIKFGYWDSLRKGLLSGERLQYDLRKMEHTHLEANRRTLELTKHISLASLAPEKLLALRMLGTCEDVELPEWLFDMDYPGHYMRRIKSVSISIPCVAGPYATISCKLSLQSSKYRKNATLFTGGTPDENYREDSSDTDPVTGRFHYNTTPLSNSASITSIATSRGQNDSGMFELSFRDERYLPFEGEGAISSWLIELPAAYPQFDYNTISDVILHINYTAIDSDDLKSAATAYVTDVLTDMAEEDGFMRLFSLRREFSNEWYAYASAFTETSSIPMTIGLHPGLFPYYTAGREIVVGPVYIKLKLKETLSGTHVIDISYWNGTSSVTIPHNLEAPEYEIAIPFDDLITITGNTSVVII